MGVVGGVPPGGTPCSTWGKGVFHMGERSVPPGGTRTWNSWNPWSSMEEDSGSRRPGGLRFRLQADGGEIEVEVIEVDGRSCPGRPMSRMRRTRWPV